jgi:serine protease Do
MNEPTPTQDTSVAGVSARKKSRITVIVLTVIALCVAIGFGGAKLYDFVMQKASTKDLSTHQSLVDDGNKKITQEEESIASVVEKVSPSVVSIITTSRTGSSRGALEQQGAGTGIIVSKDGYILTNKHVIDSVKTVQVILADGTTYDDVPVLGSDPLNDVAFLKIDNVDTLPAATMGDSSSVRVGQKVVAIGNSLGQYQNTVTSGIISGTGRPVSAQSGSSVEQLTDLFQTDAAINPGNSGGPLLNLSGQVIGINTAIIEDAQGIGFSIPINATKGILKSVLAGKGVVRAYLGINYVPITADVSTRFGLSVKKGAYVSVTSGSAVIAGSPAEAAGVKDKDIITKVGGMEVGDKGGLASLVAEYAAGDSIELTILRGDQTITLEVTLAAYTA